MNKLQKKESNNTNASTGGSATKNYKKTIIYYLPSYFYFTVITILGLQANYEVKSLGKTAIKKQLEK